MNFIEENNKERMKFVNLWSKYVMTHSDKDWSRQQNVIINSCLRAANMKKEDYLKMKGELKILGDKKYFIAKRVF